MLGGISHLSAASTLSISRVQLASFDRDDMVSGLEAFRPEIISCYPNILRELMKRGSLERLPLLAIKLGGEPVLQCDLDLIFGCWPDLLVVEQFGSTEMPATLLRLHLRGSNDPFALQGARYDYHFTEQEGWQPLLVRDRHPLSPLALDDFYDTGDEVYLYSGEIRDVRRRGCPSYPYRALASTLLPICVNMQIELENARIWHSGGRLPSLVDFQGKQFQTQCGALSYVGGKLPLCRPLR